MAARQTAAKARPRRTHLDDDTLLREGEAALKERLGTVGLLRFLRLIGGGHDRFEDIRKEWENMSMEDIMQAMRARRTG